MADDQARGWHSDLLSGTQIPDNPKLDNEDRSKGGKASYKKDDTHKDRNADRTDG
jgi:hypothetical protein